MIILMIHSQYDTLDKFNVCHIEQYCFAVSFVYFVLYLTYYPQESILNMVNYVNGHHQVILKLNIDTILNLPPIHII